jgi:hypothetical protein
MKCGEFQAQGVHLVDEHAILCANCCPVHRQASLDWPTDRPITTKAVQEGLFG